MQKRASGRLGEMVVAGKGPEWCYKDKQCGC